MAGIIKGARVRQVVTPIEGVVVGFVVDQEQGRRQSCVEFQAPDGSMGQAYFFDEEIEVVPEAAPPAGE